MKLGGIRRGEGNRVFKEAEKKGGRELFATPAGSLK